MGEAIEWRIPVGKWAAWGGASEGASTSPDLGYIEPLLRRRLSPLARAALHVANQCCQGQESVRFVYASRHGELNRTIELLHNLALGEPLSPTTFSLSVLNSAAGVFAIARADHAPATAVSAGAESFGFGLLEAYSQARANPDATIVYVYADGPPPSPIGSQAGDPPEIFAVGLLLAGTANRFLAVGMGRDAGTPSAEPQSFACWRALNSSPTVWSSGNRRWHWAMA